MIRKRGKEVTIGNSTAWNPISNKLTPTSSRLTTTNSKFIATSQTTTILRIPQAGAGGAEVDEVDKVEEVVEVKEMIGGNHRGINLLNNSSNKDPLRLHSRHNL
jgi:hypothetical protein